MDNNTGKIHKECAQDRLDKWQAANTDLVIKKGDFVKARFTEGEIDEWMWIEVNNVKNEIIAGRLDSEPSLIKRLKLHMRVSVSRNLICQHIFKKDFF